MHMSRRLAAIATLLSVTAGFTTADEKTINPQVRKIVDEVSEARIKATIEKLVSFGTRNTMSNPDDPERNHGPCLATAANRLHLSDPTPRSKRRQQKKPKIRMQRNCTHPMMSQKAFLVERLQHLVAR